MLMPEHSLANFCTYLEEVENGTSKLRPELDHSIGSVGSSRNQSEGILARNPIASTTYFAGRDVRLP